MRVARVERESIAVVSLYLEAPDGSKLPPPLPGQFLVVRIKAAQGQPAILRSYSLSGDPGAGTYRISVKKESNGIGSGLLQQVRAGELLEASGPTGSFTLTSNNEPVVLLSAGIGVTPVLAMLHELASQRSGREVWWLYGARSGKEHPFLREARELLQSLLHCRSFVCYSQPDPGDEPGRTFDAQGRLSGATLRELSVPRLADFYLCGPGAFLTGLSAALREYGVAPERIRTEIFGQREALRPGIASKASRQPHQPEGDRGAGPAISFTRSGLTVAWDARFHNLLELAEACDVPARWSCRTGVCHNCECALIGGEVEYRPDPLEPPAAGNLLICCSQPRTDLQIDL